MTHTWTSIVFMDMVMIYGEQCSVKSSGREPAGRWSINLRRDGCTASGRGSPPGTKPVHFHYENLRTGRLERLCTLILHDVVPSQFDTCIRYVLTWTCFMPGCLWSCVHVLWKLHNCLQEKCICCFVMFANLAWCVWACRLECLLGHLHVHMAYISFGCINSPCNLPLSGAEGPSQAGTWGVVYPTPLEGC